jgi:hypothetical protein
MEIINLHYSISLSIFEILTKTMSLVLTEEGLHFFLLTSAITVGIFLVLFAICITGFFLFGLLFLSLPYLIILLSIIYYIIYLKKKI